MDYAQLDLSIHELFASFNVLYFSSKLDRVAVEWSSRLTLCAGICIYSSKSHSCTIRISEPLLKFRPYNDYIDTLLHEMIHAYLFITCNNRDRDGHGQEFQAIMHEINAKAGTRISIYHTFHDEVDHYRQHIWRCDGPCRSKPPFFGLVKRSMNRPPQPADYWWNDHQRECGGTYSKISEPSKIEKKKIDKRSHVSQLKFEKNQQRLDDFIKKESPNVIELDNDSDNDCNNVANFIECPVCFLNVESQDINSHVNSCLEKN